MVPIESLLIEVEKPEVIAIVIVITVILNAESDSQTNKCDK